jgi:hypothetical protein
MLGPHPHRGSASTSGWPGRRSALLVLALVGFAVAACGPSDPLDLKVESTSPLDLDIWRANAISRLSPQQLADFNEAYQQIKFQIMAGGAANGSSEVESAALEKINALSVRGVLKLGFDAELERVETEQALRTKAISVNTQLRTRPGDAESQSFLADLHEQQLNELREEEFEIARIRRRLSAAGLPTDPPAWGDPGKRMAPDPPSEAAPAQRR